MKESVKMFSVLLNILIVNTVLQFSVAEDIIVEVPYGRINGSRRSTFTGRDYFSFQKVPFAAPPVGPLRLKAPLPPNNWDGILDASGNINVMCQQTFQDTPDESEDCLFLNVYTPGLPSGGNNPTYPVMFFIYGGGFDWGYAYYSSYGPELLVDHDVIVITANYRLGPLGFLSTGDEVIPGNYGLKDQRQALRWTFENIAAFGGDPNRITIFGQSAGSISVAYQLLDPKNEGLIYGAIMESGAALMPAGYQRDARNIAFTTAGFIDDRFNHDQDSQALLEFLQTLPPNRLDQAAQQYSWRETTEEREIYQGLYWAPVIEPDIEEAIVTDKQYGLFKNGNFLKVPIIAGFNSEEDLYENSDPDTLHNVLNDYDTHLDWLVPKDMRIEDDETRLSVGAQIRDIYAPGGLLQDVPGRGVRLLSDHSFNQGIVKQAVFSSQYTPTYFYQFSYAGQLGGSGPYYEGADSIPHGVELQYFWFTGGNGDISGWPENDQITRARLLQLWTDFAKTGNPTPETSDLLQGIIWPTVNAYNNGTTAYLDINVDLEIKLDPKNDTLVQWDVLYNNLPYDDFDTY